MPCKQRVRERRKAVDKSSIGCENALGIGAEKATTFPVVKSLTKTGCASARDSHGYQESESNQMPYDSLQALSKRELITLVHRRACRFDDADLEVLRASLVSRLQILLARVRESKSVEEASEFARWVMNSGLPKLFTGDSARDLEKLRKDVLWECECAWKHSGRGPWVAKSELEAVNERLENLAGMLTRALAGQGQFTTIPGGLVENETRQSQ